MRRLLSLAVLGTALWTGSTAAQPPKSKKGPDRPDRPAPEDRADPRPGTSDTKQLMAELERMRARVNELEARLAAKERDGDRRPPAARGDERRPNPPIPPARTDEPRRSGSDARGPGPDRGPPNPRFADRGGPPFGPRGPGFGGPGGPGRPGLGRGPGGPARASMSSPADIGRRIDRLIRELEDLKAEVERMRR
jgi:hypothetical protein